MNENLRVAVHSNSDDDAFGSDRPCDDHSHSSRDCDDRRGRCDRDRDHERHRNGHRERQHHNASTRSSGRERVNLSVKVAAIPGDCEVKVN